MVKQKSPMWKLNLKNIGKPMILSKKSKSDLALNYKITGEQLKDSESIVKKELIKERIRILKEYKKRKKGLK